MPKQIDDKDVYHAAVRVFISEGYSSTTTKAIALEAGINEATLFRKYNSKDALLSLAIIAQLRETSLTAVRYSGDLRADLLSMVNAFLSAEELVGQLVVSVIIQAPFHPQLAEAAELTVKNNIALAKIIERYQSEGLLVKQYPLSLVADLFSPIIVRRMFSNAITNLSVKSLDAEQIVDSFLNGKRRQNK